jgi:hypothetical protein
MSMEGDYNVKKSIDTVNIQILTIEKLNDDSLVFTITIPMRKGVVDLRLKKRI